MRRHLLTDRIQNASDEPAYATQPEPRLTRRYRRGAAFVLDPIAVSTRLDRNHRAKLLYLAERLELASKGKGRRNGMLGYVGLRVLRCLLLRFQNAKSGLCCPSYSSIQRATGLSRAAVAAAIARLEAAGIIVVTRRLVRQVVERICSVTGRVQRLVGIVQGSNCYGFRAESSGRPDNPQRYLLRGLPVSDRGERLSQTHETDSGFSVSAFKNRVSEIV